MGINTNIQYSKLDALNGMASYLGIPPLHDISEVPLSPDFQLAELVLDEMIQEVCAHGMPCNTDYDYTIDPDGTTGHIEIPPGAISFFPQNSGNNEYVEREGKIYDIVNKTFVFSTGVDCTVYWLYEYEDLPQVVRKYVYVAASRRLVSRVKGDNAVLATTQLDILRVETEFLTYTQQIGRVNMIYDNPESFYAIDNNSPNSGYNYAQY